MRFTGGLLIVALMGSLAAAEDAKPADSPVAPPATTPSPTRSKAPLRVVKILPETHQALLYDKIKGTHVLAEVGKTIGAFTVDDIDDDEVTLSAEGVQIVLAAPDQTWRRHRDDAEAGDAKPARPAKHDKPRATSEGPNADGGPIDPYADPEVRSVEAPTAVDVRTVEAPGATGTKPSAVGATGATPSTTAASAPTSTTVPAASATTATAHPAGPAGASSEATTLASALTGTSIESTPTVLARAEVDAALGNFAQLAGSVRGSFTPAGTKLDAIVADSLFAKAGLRNGDVITAVNNQPMRSIDDAASLYARAAGAKSLTVAIMRAGKPVALRVVIQ